MPRLLIPLCMIVMVACTDTEPRGGETPSNDALPPTPVVVAEVNAREFSETITAVGTASAAESAVITSRVQGLVERIAFDEGQRVAADALLIQLDAAEERASVAAAEAAFEQAQSRLGRLQTLADRRLASQDALGEQTERVKTARAELELARARLEQRRIRAPFAGVLGLRAVSAGALITPGTPIVTLDTIADIRSAFSIPETMLQYMVIGNAVSATAAAWPGETFEGEISAIDSRVATDTRSARIEARFDNADGRLKPGMLMTLRAQASPRDTLFIPEAALTPRDGEQYVWRIATDGESAQQQRVRIGVRVDGSVEILEGLAAGERVVVEGTANLREDRPIRITDRAPAGTAR